MDLFNNNNLGCSVDVQAQSVSDTPSASLSFSKPTSQVTDKSSKKLSTDVQAGPHTAGNVIPFSETSQPTAELTDVGSCNQTVSRSLSTHDIARYIEEKMKEQYMEQARTLEQLQLQMRQQFVEKQAQLLQQLKTLDTSGHNGASDGLGDTSQTAVNGTAPMAKAAVDETSVPHDLSNGGTLNSQHSNDVGNRDTLSNSVASGDESLNGSTSHGSSHDTWDSTNAFAHERPVLTGSERSTPTPVMSMNDQDGGGGNDIDLELMSQSIHIPFSGQVSSQREQPPERSHPQPLPQISTPQNPSKETVSLVASASDDNDTPRNTVDPCTGSGTLDDGLNSKPAEQMDQEFPSLPIDASCSLDSTPPPESPADDLSARAALSIDHLFDSISLRLSLRQKHSRHLADMKAYYENELRELRDKLTSTATVSQHNSYLKIEADNERMRQRCRVLEEELLRANRYINNVDKQMEELETSFNASLTQGHSEVKATDEHCQPELDVCKGKLDSANSYIISLESRNNELFSALCDAYEVRDSTALAAKQENVKFQELQENYSQLKLDHDLVNAKLKTTDSCLAEALREIDSLKQTVHHLEAKMSSEASQFHTNNLSFSRIDSSGEQLSMSPMLKAEQHHLVSMSSTPNSPSRHRSSRPRTSDKSKHKKKVIADTTNDHSSNALPNSDTQSSESSRDAVKHKLTKSSYKNTSDRRLAKDSSTVAPTVCKDDLISAYSPIVDRQRHSSSASSSGPTRPTSSPSRQSAERPFGFHHVGACISPSRRSHSSSILSPFKRTPDMSSSKQGRLKPANPSSAKKLLDFSPQQSTSPSCNSDKKLTESEVLDKVRSGKVYIEPTDGSNSTPSASMMSSSKSSRVQEDRLQLVRDAEKRLDELLLEKRQLESCLTRISASHGRKDRQRQESLERQLDRVDKDLGSVRMTLRRYNIL